MKIVLLLILVPVGLFALYVVSMLIFGTITDWQPPETELISVQNPRDAVPTDSIFTFVTWNVGYGGLGAQSDFFYDAGGGMVTANGAMVRSSADQVEEYTAGIVRELFGMRGTDFVLLQEVDRDAKRSRHTDQFTLFGEQALDEHERSHALNYNARFVPIPLLHPSPLGRVRSGLATYSAYATYDATRHQFPGNFPWPTRIFMLDRCFLTHRVPLPSGKELVVVNSHNSAYDDGTLKQQQMRHLNDFLQAEYAKGNHVVVGADWNQCPPGFAYDSFSHENADDYHQTNIPADDLPAGWTWAYDPTVPTNRKLATPHTPGETFVTLIDFFLVSPNVEVLEVEGIDLDFAMSDHQPVRLKVRLLP